MAEDGRDANDGSEGAPWATLQHAVESIRAGDTIVVHQGEYLGMRIEHSGKQDAWNTLRAATGERVVVEGPGPENEHGSNIEIETWEGEGTVAYWVIEGLEVTKAPSWGIDVRGVEDAHSKHIIIRNNSVHDNGLETGRTGIFTAFVDDVTITENESYRNGEHGIYLSNSGDRFLVAGNQLYENVYCGLHINGDASQGGDGVISDGIVEANVIYENGLGGCSAINMDGVTRTIVRNNLIYENHAGGISLFQENGAICSRDNRLLHNTILMAEDGRWAINLSDTSCVRNQLFNNIILTRHDWRGSILIPEPGVEGFESDHNILMDRFSADDDNSVISLAEWQDLGYDQNSLLAGVEDVFLDPSNHDFHLRAGGLAVDRGLNLPDAVSDLEGNPRPQGSAVDIGAYELSVGEQATSENPTPEIEPGDGGRVTYTLGERVYTIEAQEEAVPEDVSEALESISPGTFDEVLNISPDGGWLVLETDRFDPECPLRGSCLALVRADLSSPEAVRTPDGLLEWQGMVAAASGGNLLVYGASGGPNELDLWAVHRSQDGWESPILLTDASPFEWNHQPALAASGATVLFDCGPEPYGAEGTAICEVGTDGGDFRIVVEPEDSPPGFPNSGALHHPDYEPDGGVVFEADWDGEQIWRLPPGQAVPELISPDFDNDNSPCVLPDGRVVSLWLGRAGVHEIKVMRPDGSSYFLLLPERDVEDIGIGCGL